MGDKRCIAHGHLVRLVVWKLRLHWNLDAPLTTRLAQVTEALDNVACWDTIRSLLETSEPRKYPPEASTRSLFAEPDSHYATDDYVAF